MVWLVEKKVFNHIVEIGSDLVRIPIRVKLEFAVKAGIVVQETLTISSLYNRQAVQKHYPCSDIDALDSSIDRKVKQEVENYLKHCGFLKEAKNLNQPV
jgi:hypothetical protein